MLACDGEVADRWSRFPYDLAHISGNSVIRKIVREQHADGTVSVTAHSTHDYASNAENFAVHGTDSAVQNYVSATQVKLDNKAAARERVTNELYAELAKCVSKWVPLEGNAEEHAQRCRYGPLMHRWGAAFPVQDSLLHLDGLSLEVPSAKVVFCGDIFGPFAAWLCLQL